MRSRTQHKPLGNDSETDFQQSQQDRGQTELQFYDSTTVKWEHTTRGIRAHVKPFSANTPASGGGSFVGEIDLTGATAYTAQQWGVISSGPSKGTYVCILDTDAASNPPTLPPGNSLYWTCVSDGQAQMM